MKVSSVARSTATGPSIVRRWRVASEASPNVSVRTERTNA
jgi:hypothetical protein